jgi:hypothetical protein
MVDERPEVAGRCKKLPPRSQADVSAEPGFGYLKSVLVLELFMPVDSYTCGKNLTNKYKIVLTDIYSTASSNLPEIIARLLSDQFPIRSDADL